MSLTTIPTPHIEKSLLTDADHLKDYERVKIVGQGSFGIAVLYRKHSDSSLVVLKQVEMSNLTTSEKELALNEVDVFSKLHHPNIISYMGSFICANTLIIEMEYADGGTLAQIIAERSADLRFIPERNVVTIFEQITSSIKYMHGENIIHRDLKTANVFLNKKGVVKIGDFGISKMMNTRIHTQTVLGTPYYFSPEMCEGSDYDNKSDIWALGCILGEMCCLRKCFAASNLSELVTMIMAAKYLPLPEKYSPVLREVLNQLLQVESKNRPPATDILQNWIPLLYKSLQSYEGYIDTEPIKVHGTTINLESSLLPLKSTSINILVEKETSSVGERSIVYKLTCTPNNNVHIEPIIFPKIVQILTLSHSASHFIAVTSDGSAFTFGETSHGQLGIGQYDQITQSAPIRVDYLKKFNLISACAGQNFSTFLSECGKLFSCGDNTNGVLGDPTASRVLQPKFIERLKGKRIVQITCGRGHVVALDSSQHLYSWGSSKYGALGQGDSCIKSNTPSRMNMSSIYQPFTIHKVVCGPECSFVILKTGELYACGSNRLNRLGLSIKLKRIFQLSRVNGIKHSVVDVCCSNYITVVLVQGGYIYSIGRNTEGQRGLSHCNKVLEPTLVVSLKEHFIMSVKCSDFYCVAHSDANVAYIWGTRQIKQTTKQIGAKSELNTNISLDLSLFRSEIILDPIELLALYSPDHLVKHGFSVEFNDIILQEQLILAVVNTTAPPG